MAKYRRKRKNNITVIFGILIISVLLFISVGYSLWTDTLSINGKVNLKYKEPKLEQITVNQTDGQYITRDEDYMINALTVESSSVNNNENTIGVEAEVSMKSYTITARDVTFSMSFVNNYSSTISNGKVEVFENTTGRTIDSTTITELVTSGGTANFSSTFKLTRSVSTSVLKYKIAYDVDGVTRYLYLTINITK